MKPIRVWMTPAGPNPWKVILLLEDLQVSYDIKSIRFEEVKKDPLISINPNGRVPAIEDPNTNISLWESGAIIQYLVEQYDADNRLSYNTLQEQHLCNQWLMFQVSGQGPYFGQAGWFGHLHPEKIPSAILRYSDEPCFLVGDKITFADLSFVPWNDRVDVLLGVPADKKFDGFPCVKEWHGRMIQRPSWAKAMEHRSRIIDEQGLDWNGMPKGTRSFQEYEATGAGTASS